jgi:hypothetical protein
LEEGKGKGRRTFGVELHDLQVHIGVCSDQMELLVEGKEVSGEGFEMVFAAAEEVHVVWLFLVKD